MCTKKILLPQPLQSWGPEVNLLRPCKVTIFGETYVLVLDSKKERVAHTLSSQINQESGLTYLNLHKNKTINTR